MTKGRFLLMQNSFYLLSFFNTQIAKKKNIPRLLYLASVQPYGTYHTKSKNMGSLCNPAIAGSAVLLCMAENSCEMCVSDYFLCTCRRNKNGENWVMKQSWNCGHL